jgi:hypothetical protein
MLLVLYNLWNMKEVPGEYFFELILLCALTVIVLIPLGIKLSQRVLSSRPKYDNQRENRL